MSSGGRKYAYVLLVIVLVALALRVGFVLTMENEFYFPDSDDYHLVAKNLLEGKGLIMGQARKSYRPPGYPVFLSAIYLVFGYATLPIRITQALISALTTVLIYKLAKKLFGKLEGYVAAGISAIYPFFIFFSGLVLYETLLIFLLVLFITFIHQAYYKSLLWAVFAGALAGVIAMVSPGMALLPIFMCAMFILFLRLKRWVCVFSILLAMMFLVMAPWVVRNYKIHNELVILTTQSGYTLYEGAGDFATGGPRGAFMTFPDKEYYQELSETEKDSYLKGLAIEAISKEPLRFIKLSLIKCARMWNFVINYERYRKWSYNLASILSYGPVLILGLIGIGILISQKNRAAVILLCAPILYKTLIHMIFVGSIRYRIVVMPFMIILAAYSLLDILRRSNLIKRPDINRTTAG